MVNKELTPNWPKDRLDELALLQDMIKLIDRLNRGSHFIDNIKEVMLIANQLDNICLKSGRRNFVGFLTNEAWKEVDKQ